MTRVMKYVKDYTLKSLFLVNTPMTEKYTYRKAGVDIDSAASFVERIKPLIKRTFRKEVMSHIGGFGGLFHLEIGKFKDPVLVSSADGVGTKLKVAQMMDKHDTVGIDLVAMSVNDVLVQGAEPLFFLDYIATGKLNIERNLHIIEGIVKGCQEAGCALLGGETAEMPGFYEDDEYDLAGFCVGVVDADKLIDGSEIRVGDRIIGITSSGIHSNGFSLVRRILFEERKYSVYDRIQGLDDPLGVELLKPTRIYVRPILNVIKKFGIKGLVHITGGGFLENIPRILPQPCRAIILKNSWQIPPLFIILQEMGNIDEYEMFRVFNMGIGFIAIVSEKEAPELVSYLEQLGQTAYTIGIIEKRSENQLPILFI